MQLSQIAELKGACSRIMTETNRQIRQLECQYNSALFQWNRLDEQEHAHKAMETYLALAKPEAA